MPSVSGKPFLSSCANTTPVAVRWSRRSCAVSPATMSKWPQPEQSLPIVPTPASSKRCAKQVLTFQRRVRSCSTTQSWPKRTESSPWAATSKACRESTRIGACPIRRASRRSKFARLAISCAVKPAISLRTCYGPSLKGSFAGRDPRRRDGRVAPDDTAASPPTSRPRSLATLGPSEP